MTGSPGLASTRPCQGATRCYWVARAASLMLSANRDQRTGRRPGSHASPTELGACGFTFKLLYFQVNVVLQVYRSHRTALTFKF